MRAHPLSWTGRVQEEKVVRRIRDRFCTTRCGMRSRCSGSRCFFTNIDSLMPGLQNLWRAVRRFLLSEETLPRLLISKAVTVVLMCVISVTKCAYLFEPNTIKTNCFPAVPLRKPRGDARNPDCSFASRQKNSPGRRT